MGVNYALEFQEGGDESWFFIKTHEAPLLIGENGKHLAAFSYLVKKVYEKKFPAAKTPIQFLVDINDYNKKRIEEIKDSHRSIEKNTNPDTKSQKKVLIEEKSVT